MSVTLIPFSSISTSKWVVTARPSFVVVRMKFGALSISLRGSPAQFLLIWLNNRRAMGSHLAVSGGSWVTETVRPNRMQGRS